jgi:hypothetical protein
MRYSLAVGPMRKRIITPVPQGAPATEGDWLDVGSAAAVEVTSEDKAHPIEGALLPGEKHGWRADGSGAQTIRILFDKPQRLRRIRLAFEETETTRTQEFVLRWSPDQGQSFREIVRQQRNFSPPETIREIEDYTVALADVTVLELVVVPDKSGGQTHASLESLRLS